MLRQRIEASTRRWIERFVIREKLCPFAARSSIHVQVELFGDEALFAERQSQRWQLTAGGNERQVIEAVSRMGTRIEHLLKSDVQAEASSNLFLVWPVGLDDHDSFMSFSRMCISWFGLGDGTGGPEASDVAAVGFPFHPHAGGPGSYVFRSPYPMLHLIPIAELDRARTRLRRRDNGKGMLIQQQNSQLMRAATAHDREKWDMLLRECRVQCTDEKRTL